MTRFTLENNGHLFGRSFWWENLEFRPLANYSDAAPVI